MNRAEILDDAKQKVTVDRAADHGDMEDNFSTIAAYWTTHLGTQVSAHDVAVMMTLRPIEERIFASNGILKCVSKIIRMGW